MAAKGKAAKSASGASMSKYDVEVEKRLQDLENKIQELQSHSHGGSSGGMTSECQEMYEWYNRVKRLI